MSAVYKIGSGQRRQETMASRIVFRQQLVRGLALAIIAGLAVALTLALARFAEPTTAEHWLTWSRALPSLHVVLLSAWVVALMAAAMGAHRARRVRRHAVGHAISASVVAQDGPRVDQADWEKSVLGVVTAMGLLGPLSLHALISAPGLSLATEDFWRWGLWSLILTTHVHALGIYRLRRSARALFADPGLKLIRALGGTLLYTSLLALVPGIILFGISSVLVFVTGLVVYGATYAWLAGVVREEAVFMRGVRAA